MKCSECKMMFAAALVMILAITAFCVIGESDDSYADSNGNVLGPDTSVIGTYTLNGHTLTLRATSVSAVTSVTLDGFVEQDAVQKIIIIGFVDNITGSFAGYANLETIEYQGTVSTGGSWTFDFFEGAIHLLSDGDSDSDYIQLDNFNMQPLVTSVIIRGYLKNLSSSFNAYSSLGGNITYEGSVPGTYGGLWWYELKTKTLTVDRPQSSSCGLCSK